MATLAGRESGVSARNLVGLPQEAHWRRRDPVQGCARRSALFWLGRQPGEAPRRPALCDQVHAATGGQPVVRRQPKAVCGTVSCWTFDGGWKAASADESRLRCSPQEEILANHASSLHCERAEVESKGSTQLRSASARAAPTLLRLDRLSEARGNQTAPTERSGSTVDEGPGPRTEISDAENPAGLSGWLRDGSGAVGKVATGTRPLADPTVARHAGGTRQRNRHDLHQTGRRTNVELHPIRLAPNGDGVFANGNEYRRGGTRLSGRWLSDPRDRSRGERGLRLDHRERSDLRAGEVSRAEHGADLETGVRLLPRWVLAAARRCAARN